ncbi:MAG: hypothetical protein JJE39_01510 [Vicinamibacteria bacterium]|nr:hypothetical protein [Vicinamibacteria bacterium]
MATILLSYAAGAAVHASNQRTLLASARSIGGFDRIQAHGPLAADHPLRLAHRDIFEGHEGAGYWLWKPQVILQALESGSPGDIVVYVDSGARLRRSLAPLIALARAHDAVLFLNDHANAPYTKRDAYILTGTDVADCHGTKQLDAAFMLWRNTARSRRLVSEWLRVCRDARALTDQPGACGLPELPSFRAHRHDQALLSLLVFRDRQDLSLALLPRRVKYRFLEHHRRRIAWLPIALWHATHDAAWETRRRVARRRDVRHRRGLGLAKRLQGDPCRMQRLSDRRLYSTVDHCLSFLRTLPEAPPREGPPEPVHFYWDGPGFGAKPALCLRSFLATQDSRRVRPWLWLAHSRAWDERAVNPHLIPLLPHIEARRFDLATLAQGTPLAAESWPTGLQPAAASDLARLLCTFHHGGFYSDLDAVFLRDLGPLLNLTGGRDFGFQWSLTRRGTNAFCRHARNSPLLLDLMNRVRETGSGHPEHLFDFETGPSEMLILPVAAFSPAWLVVDGHDQSAFSPFTRFDDFFAPRPPDDPRRATVATIFPGAFTYHWHGRWGAPEAASSWAGQLAEDIHQKLASKLRSPTFGPRYGS